MFPSSQLMQEIKEPASAYMMSDQMIAAMWPEIARRSSSRRSRRHGGTGDDASNTKFTSGNYTTNLQTYLPLPMELWRQVALYMSSRDLARGLNQVCKALRHLSASAICLESSYEDAVKWTQERWSSASILLLQPRRYLDRRDVFVWAGRHCQELGPLEQLGVDTTAFPSSMTNEHHAAAIAEAMTPVLANQAGHLRVLRLNVWAISSLPQMTQLKHLIICRRAGETDGHSDDSMSSIFTCLQHLAELETLDLKLLSSKGQCQYTDLELPGLTKLRRVRLSNIAADALVVAPGCQITIRQWSDDPIYANMCKTAHLAIHSTTWELPEVIISKWPAFVSKWAGLQKLDLQAVAMGAPKKERLSLGAMAHIPILRLNSNLAMFLMVPRRAKWKHLWLECRGVLDLKFEDVTTFAQSLSELRMVYAGFNGHEVGSDVLLSLNLIQQGLNSITDAYEVKSKLKCLSATRTSAKSVARRVHNTCICGACMACLVGAGIMYNHFPGDKAALTDPSPTRKYSMRAPAAYGSPRCDNAAEHDQDKDKEFECFECIQRRELEQDVEKDYRMKLEEYQYPDFYFN